MISAAEPESSEDQAADKATSDAGGQELESATSGSDEAADDGIVDAEVIEVAEDAPAESEAKAEAEEATLPEPVVAAPPPPRSGGGLGAVFGGLVAGAIGFLAATFLVPQDETGDVSAAMSEQAKELDALSAEVTSLKDSLAAVPPVPEGIDLAPLTESIAAVEARVSELAASIGDRIDALDVQLAGFETRLADIEARPQGPVTPDGSAAMEAQLEAFRQQLDTVTADAEARISEAQNRASEIEAAAAAEREAAERDAALSSLKTAMNDGTPFAETLAAFSDVPADLKAAADKGVPTLSDLQGSFAAAARAALAHSGAVDADASATDKFTAFLRRQTNARSLAPREGDTADAILSRAEAALDTGDLDTALSELAALPDTARSAMADWIGAAEMRAAALASVAKLETPTN